MQIKFFLISYQCLARAVAVTLFHETRRMMTTVKTMAIVGATGSMDSTFARLSHRAELKKV